VDQYQRAFRSERHSKIWARTLNSWLLF
jgi:hypothetical protein